MLIFRLLITFRSIFWNFLKSYSNPNYWIVFGFTNIDDGPVNRTDSNLARREEHDSVVKNRFWPIYRSETLEIDISICRRLPRHFFPFLRIPINFDVLFLNGSIRDRLIVTGIEIHRCWSKLSIYRFSGNIKRQISLRISIWTCRFERRHPRSLIPNHYRDMVKVI